MSSKEHKKGGIGYLGCKFESIKNFVIEVVPKEMKEKL